MTTLVDMEKSAATVPIEYRFNPYSDNGGTIVGIAGKDFAVLAGDTRQSSGYSINTRYSPRVHHIGDNIVASANGFAADGDAVVRTLKQNIEWYHHNNNDKRLAISSCARMTRSILYGKRFFPFYVYTLLAGIDPQDGKGAIYSFDPIGSYERETCRAGGAAASLIMPFLDNQVNLKNQYDPATGEKKSFQDIPLERVIDIIKDAFTSATERHILVGDGLEILIVTKDGVTTEYFPLKKD